jgi:membrane protease YdiL (CAAX protease family)
VQYSKIKAVVWLLVLPFLVTGVERLIFKPLIIIFPVPETSVYLFKVVASSLLLLAFAAYFGKTYGLEMTQKLRKVLAAMLVVLLVSSYIFLVSLKVKHFFDSFAVIHLVNWIVTVFREEFLLRGVIQTEANSIFKGKWLKISGAIWLSTIAFSVWHLVNLVVWPWQTVVLQMIACLPAGVALGLIKEKTDNTLLTYLLHISGDLLFFALYTLLFGKLFFSLF